jgi:hypothetical protein
MEPRDWVVYNWPVYQPPRTRPIIQSSSILLLVLCSTFGSKISYPLYSRVALFSNGIY